MTILRARIKGPSNREAYFPDVFVGLTSCPHCMTRRPEVRRLYAVEKGLNSLKFGGTVFWAVYTCSSCSLPISLLQTDETYRGPSVSSYEYLVFPGTWQPDEVIPDRARNYLNQANETLGSPDASVLMAAAAIDAMLKEKGLVDGTLYARIDAAVEQGLLTKDMSEWAHLVRLNSNNPRHADVNTPHLTTNDAKLSLDFAKAIAEVLFVLPSRLPAKDVPSE